MTTAEQREYSPLEYGAVGDAVTDDTSAVLAAVQAAIDASSEGPS